MAVANRIIFCAVVTLALVAPARNTQRIEYAKHSAVRHRLRDRVQRGARRHARALSEPRTTNPGPGRISTAWHQVKYADDQDADMVEPADAGERQRRAGAEARPTRCRDSRRHADAPRLQALLHSLRHQRRRRPAVARQGIGHASEWEPGAAMPVELHGLRDARVARGRAPRRCRSRSTSRSSSSRVPMKEEDAGRAARTSCRRPIRRRSAAVPTARRRRSPSYQGHPQQARLRSAAPAARRRHRVEPRRRHGRRRRDGDVAGRSRRRFDAMAAAIAGGCGADGDKKVAVSGRRAEAGRVPARPRAARRGLEGHLVRARRVALSSWRDPLDKARCPAPPGNTCYPRARRAIRRASSDRATRTICIHATPRKFRRGVREV